MRTLATSRLLAPLALFLSASSAHASFHLWDVEEIFTSADGTVQFIELLCPNTASATNEFFVSGTQITATSDGVPVSFTLNHQLTGQTSTAGRTFFLATSAFAGLTGAVTPDFSPLPNNFINPNAASITINFASVDILTFAGSLLPKNGVTSLVDHDPAGAGHLVAETNSPKNFAGASGSVTVSNFAAADFTENGVVNSFDLANWHTNFGATATATHLQGDSDGDKDVDGRDFLKWQEQTTNAGALVATASLVPEPSSAILAAIAVASLAAHRRRRVN